MDASANTLQEETAEVDNTTQTDDGLIDGVYPIRWRREKMRDGDKLCGDQEPRRKLMKSSGQETGSLSRIPVEEQPAVSLIEPIDSLENIEKTPVESEKEKPVEGVEETQNKTEETKKKTNAIVPVAVAKKNLETEAVPVKVTRKVAVVEPWEEKLERLLRLETSFDERRFLAEELLDEAPQILEELLNLLLDARPDDKDLRELRRQLENDILPVAAEEIVKLLRSLISAIEEISREGKMPPPEEIVDLLLHPPVARVIRETRNALKRTPEGFKTPTFKLLREIGGQVELRRYKPMVVARVRVPKDESVVAAAAKAFRKLSRYFEGSNQRRKKMEMSLPVVAACVEGDWVTMEVALPSEMSVDDAPAPRDPEMVVEVIPSRTLAVRTFSGIATAPEVSRQTSSLRRRLNAAAATGEASAVGGGVWTPVETGRHWLMFYSSPLALPWLRRNEVAVKVHVDVQGVWGEGMEEEEDEEEEKEKEGGGPQEGLLEEEERVVETSENSQQENRKGKPEEGPDLSGIISALESVVETVEQQAVEAQEQIEKTTTNFEEEVLGMGDSEEVENEEEETRELPRKKVRLEVRTAPLFLSLSDVKDRERAAAAAAAEEEEEKHQRWRNWMKKAALRGPPSFFQWDDRAEELYCVARELYCWVERKKRELSELQEELKRTDDPVERDNIRERIQVIDGDLDFKAISLASAVEEVIEYVRMLKESTDRDRDRENGSDEGESEEEIQQAPEYRYTLSEQGGRIEVRKTLAPQSQGEEEEEKQAPRRRWFSFWRRSGGKQKENRDKSSQEDESETETGIFKIADAVLASSEITDEKEAMEGKRREEEDSEERRRGWTQSWREWGAGSGFETD